MANEKHGLYVISVAADLAGVHPQALRAYERKGLLSPARTEGGTAEVHRRSRRDLVPSRQAIVSWENTTHRASVRHPSLATTPSVKEVSHGRV